MDGMAFEGQMLPALVYWLGILVTRATALLLLSWRELLIIQEQCFNIYTWE